MGLTGAPAGALTLTAMAEGVAPQPGSDVYLCIRGEDVVLAPGEPGLSSARNHLVATVRALLPEGPLSRVVLDVQTGPPGAHQSPGSGLELTALITRRSSEELGLQVHSPVIAHIKATAIRVIPRG